MVEVYGEHSLALRPNEFNKRVQREVEQYKLYIQETTKANPFNSPNPSSRDEPSSVARNVENMVEDEQQENQNTTRDRERMEKKRKKEMKRNEKKENLKRKICRREEAYDDVKNNSKGEAFEEINIAVSVDDNLKAGKASYETQMMKKMRAVHDSVKEIHQNVEGDNISSKQLGISLMEALPKNVSSHMYFIKLIILNFFTTGF
jgi:hypothetical protein